MRAIVMLLAVVTVGAVLAPPAPALPVPDTACEVFPADNVWRLDVSKLPVHPKSARWKRAMHARRTLLHPDFGPPSYGIPFDVVDASHDDVSVDLSYASESDPGPYPFGPETQIEGGSDRHAIMIDSDTARSTNCSPHGGTVGAPKPDQVRSSISRPTRCGPPAGRAPMPRVCRSSRVCCAPTR
jgi:hypothetical protein